ncbi:hypothetical protein PF001_g15779 [Phytophthora fragariae]|uniref:Uncharacterized protein n=1 Tax=Phytophthora fragariae TaxID=53985 RepID=A0A6A4D6W3_9STRA|nr:hypothetical protein PF001_g15779 [Phytophthora fragariae]
MEDHPVVTASTACPPVKPASLSRRQRAWRLICEAASLVLKVMRPVCTCGPLAWILTYVFTLGTILTGQPPALQSHRDLISMTVLVSTSFHGISVFVTYALSLRNFHRLDGSRWTFAQLVGRFIKKTWAAYSLAHILVVGGTYVIVSVAHAFSATFKLHLYLACAWNSLYRASVDEASRSIYQRETLEGVEGGHVNDAPYWGRYVQAVGRSINFAVIAMLAASLVHVCSALDMLNSSFASLKFSVASVVLKSIVLSITKCIALQHGGTHLRKIYVLTAVPTVLINTQVRLVLLQNVKSGSSVRSFLELGMLEPLLRVTKVWHLQRTIDQVKRNSQSRVSSVASLRARVHRISAILPLPHSLTRHQTQTARLSKLVRPATILDSRQSLLHFHAAESHADMCSEYIAIICSTSIFFFLQRHSRFGWHEAGDSGDVAGWEETLLAGSWQVGIEVVVDFVCCAFELANGIPLHDSESLGGFLTAVFTCTALVSVSISTVLCAHDAASTST